MSDEILLTELPHDPKPELLSVPVTLVFSDLLACWPGPLLILPRPLSLRFTLYEYLPLEVAKGVVGIAGL